MYSVREMLPKDFDGTLHQLGAEGYKVVEAAGYFNKTAAEWKRSMDQAGLRCVSTHHALPDLKAKLPELIEYAKAIGLEYMICSWAAVHRDPSEKGPLSLDDWSWVADQLTQVGEKVKAAGMQFGYHNHYIEFNGPHGSAAYETLLKKTDPKYLVFEMDCGWVVAGGADPVHYLSQDPQRFPLLHVKDLVKQPDGKWKNVVMGKGTIDYAPIFKAAKGLKYYFIEQEEFQGDPMQELRADADYMKRFHL